MMKKTLFLATLFLTCTLILSAQDIDQKIKEAGISLSGPYSFGIRYRTGTENTLLRITLLSLNGNTYSNKSDSDPSSKNRLYGVGTNIGFEKRKSLSDKTSFYYGSDLLMSYRRESHENPRVDQTSKSNSFSPGAGLVLGFVYSINSNMNISAEIVPSIIYSYTRTVSINNGTEREQVSKALEYGFSNTMGNLTLSFRLGKKSY